MTRKFRVLAHARGSALIRPSEELAVNFLMDGRPIALSLKTSYRDRGFTAAVPGDLWLDAQGDAEDIRAAMSIFANAGRDMAALVAVSANAAIAPLEPEIAYESTPGLTTREYFQRYMPAEGMSLTSRFVDVPATSALISAVAKHSERDRLIRAVSQYTEALNQWRIGFELLAMSHLFMGVEAMKRAAWRHTLASKATTKEIIGAGWGYKADGRLSLETFLDNEARARLVFQNDRECHKAAKDTSDHFEHGFSNAGSLYKGAGNHLVLTAKYLREAILAILDLPDEHRTTMLGEKYARPRGPTRLEKYLWANLVGTGDELAPPGSEYPSCDWVNKVDDVTFDAVADKFSLKESPTFTPRIAAGMSIQNVRAEIFDGSTFEPPGLLKNKGT